MKTRSNMGRPEIQIGRVSGKKVEADLHMAELTDQELKDLVADCQDELARRKSGASVS